jgi:hypothetical protein
VIFLKKKTAIHSAVQGADCRSAVQNRAVS